MLSESSGPPCAIHLPTASRPRLNFLAKVSLTTATRPEPCTSEVVNSRPASSGTPNVRKKSVPTSLNRAPLSMSGPLSKPSTDTLLPQLLPASSGTIAAVTPVTPGSAASSSSTRANSCCERAFSYPLRLGEMPNVTTLSIRSPRSTRLTLERLFRNRPAEMSSAIDNAI